MNEHCRIGLHAFTDWKDKDGVQIRSCTRCRATETREWRPQDKPGFDPYRDLF